MQVCWSLGLKYFTSSLMTVVLLHDLKAVVIFLPKSAKTIIEANKIVFINGNGNAS